MRYFITILIIYVAAGCNTNRQPVQYTTEALDTIPATATLVIAEPGLFETAFIKGNTYPLNDSIVQLYGVNIGKLNIPTGRIVACDPMHIDEYGIPFTQVFPTGAFPVQLSVARQGMEERIAFARIYFSDAPVARWEFALQEGQKPLPVGGKKIEGYGVDGGLGIFADEAACRLLNKENLMSLDDSVYREMDKHTRYDWRYNIHRFGDHNLAMFSTGFGDGRYATYIGFDSVGKPCRLLTDMDVLKWKKR